ncbi:MAG: penicillin-binding protein 2 [Kiritimatiellia bacterium]
MHVNEPKPLSNWRIALLSLILLAGLALLCMRLYRLQVVQSAAFEQRQMRQNVRRVLLPSPRGRILDCRGRLLADNQPNYCLAIYLEELRRPGRWSNTVDAVEVEINQLAAVLQLPRACLRRRIEEHVRRSLPLPLIAWEHLSDISLARFVECRRNFPGVDVFVQPERCYPFGRMAAHLLGRVGRNTELATEARAEDYQYHLPGLKGIGGLEQEYNDLLCGLPGGQQIRVDAVGYRRDEWTAREPVPGRDLNLTIDSEIQLSLDHVLAGVRGAGVVLDPRNGDILAMASAPSLDPNVLSPAPSPDVWQALRDDPDRPLINRAIAGCYPPGSTFKPFVALAAQTLGNRPPTTTYICDGTFQLGNRIIHCAHGEQHGTVDMRKAIEVSCNVYFCNLARDMGYEAIWTVAQQVGIGRRSGIDLPGETAGLLPSEQWKTDRQLEPWSAGDTCNVAIGQGSLQVSPLQMAVATAALANGGRVLRPRIRRGVPEGEVVSRTGWPAAAIALVQEGMQDVVSGEAGTGRRARIAGIQVAAKTGTAEYRVDGAPKKYGWMISFAPAEAPRVVVVMVVEEALTGGLTVGPRLQRVLQTIFAREIAAGRKEATT